MKLNLEYATTLGNHPFGIALYQPPTTSEMKPGIVGYFDRFGCWNVVADLANQRDLELKDLHPPEDLVKARTNRGIKWGPITSSNTRATKIDLSAGVSPVLGFPAAVSAAYSYQNDEDVGAILLTSAPIVHERYYHATPFNNWIVQNGPVILNRWRDEVKENGLWIVTSTFSTKKCAINMWTSKGKGVKIGFSVDVMGAGHIGPGVDWYFSHADRGWGEYTAEGDDRCVVFFSGFKFNFNQSLFKDPSLVPSRPIELMIAKQARKSPKDEEHREEHSTVPKYVTTIPDPKDCHQEFEVYCIYIGEHKSYES